MLSKLVIKNFAIIDELELSFENKLGVITGETGAGKSILLGALELVLGKRANHSVILNKEKKCSIEAIFKTNPNSTVNDVLRSLEYEIYDELIIRREISPTGRSRSFLNDTPANLEDLQNVGRNIIDLHKQFDSYELLQSSEQLNIIDGYLQLEEERLNFTANFLKYQTTEKALIEKKEAIAQAKAEQDYLNFVFQEIESLQLQEGSIETWGSRLSLLENAHAIKEVLLRSAHQLSDAEPALISSLQEITKQLGQHAQASKELASLEERLLAVIEELKDISAEFEIQDAQIEDDDEELETLNQKMEEANKLLLKHNAANTKDLMSIQTDFSNKLENMSVLDADIQNLEKEKELLKLKCEEQAKKLSKKRIAGLTKFNKAMNALLPNLGFVNAVFDTAHSFIALSKKGIDQINFLFDANSMGKMQELRQAVSGGEMSRIMLAIKSLLADKTEMPCLIFDEIDTGISGTTALQVGKTLKNLAHKHQVLCITHLPQIAAQGQHHYQVSKSISIGKQQTTVTKLSDEERVAVLAQMLSGTAKSAHAMRTAKELLDANK